MRCQGEPVSEEEARDFCRRVLRAFPENHHHREQAR